ncbi:MAG TPA: hypothetical protein EYG73_00075 [Arcobacter sp.]|nr:hypothetical protein [Arcobacter sp.]
MKNIFSLFFIIGVILSPLSAKEEMDYDKLFYFLENKGIVVGEDISNDDLFNIINSNKIYLDNGTINQEELNKKIKQLMTYKEEQYSKIHDKLNANPKNKINKEIISYFKDNNDRVQETQDKLSENDNNGWFSSMINYILEFLKN